MIDLLGRDARSPGFNRSGVKPGALQLAVGEFSGVEHDLDRLGVRPVVPVRRVVVVASALVERVLTTPRILRKLAFP